MQLYLIIGLRDSLSIRSDTSRQSTCTLSNTLDVESVFSDAFGDIEFPEACALFAINDDSTSICASTASSQRAQVPSKKQFGLASKWKPKW